MAIINLQIDIKAPLDHVWKTWTESNPLNQWSSTKTLNSKPNEFIEYQLSDQRHVKISFQSIPKGTELSGEFEVGQPTAEEIQQSGWQTLQDQELQRSGWYEMLKDFQTKAEKTI